MRNNFFGNVNQAIDFFKQLDKIDYVLCGTLALMNAGVSVERGSFPHLLHLNKAGDKLVLYGVVGYFYSEDLKLDKYCKLLEGTTVYVPTVERALVECIKHNMKFVDEGVFCDSLERYQHDGNFNYDLLLEVANEFSVSKEDIDYWLSETEDFNSY